MKKKKTIYKAKSHKSEQLKRLLLKIKRWIFLKKWLIAIAVALVIGSLIFVCGLIVGREAVKREFYFFKPSELPLAMQRIMDSSLGYDWLKTWQGRIIMGKVIGINDQSIKVQTNEGERVLDINEKTRYLRGKTPINRLEIVIGTNIGVWLDQTKSIVLLTMML